MARKIVLVIFSFVAALCTVCLTLSLTALFTVTNFSYVYNQLASSDYYKTAYQSVLQSAVKKGEAAGLPASVVQQAITQSIVRRDIEITLQHDWQYLNGEASSYTVDTDLAQYDILPPLRTAINSYAQSNQISLSGTEATKILNTYLDEVRQSYNSAVSVIPYAAKVMPKLRAVFAALPWVAFFSAVALAALAVLGTALAGRNNHTMGVIHCLYGLIAGGGLVMALAGGLRAYDLSAHFVVFTDVIQQFAGQLLNGYFSMTVVTGMLFAAVGVAVSLILSMATKRRIGF